MSIRSMKKATIRFNYDDYILLPEDKRYEILAGDLYLVPAPDIRHQRVSIQLSTALHQRAKERGLGTVLEAPCDVVLSQQDIVQPDLLFIREQRSGIMGEQNIQGAPDIVIEILSKATRDRDMQVKRKMYSSFGIQEYWIVDPEADTVEVLIWSELGYVSTGIQGKSDRLCSPLLPYLQLLLSEVFPD
jgi:Uma2 family endonuclease